MKKSILILILILSFTLLFAGEQGDIMNALKLSKLTEKLNLNEKQIAKYLIMEKNIKDIHIKYMEKNKILIEGLKKDVNNKKYSNADNVLNAISKNEQAEIVEINKIRKTFFNTLNNEQKAKFILFEAEFRRRIRDFMIDKKNMKREINKKQMK